MQVQTPTLRIGARLIPPDVVGFFFGPRARKQSEHQFERVLRAFMEGSSGNGPTW
jgi:hypothetical protein